MSKYRLNAGVYRHIVTFQKLVETQDTYGETVNEWTDEVKARVGIFPLSGKEFFSAHQISNEISHKVNMRYQKGITSEMRFIYDGRIFNIISVINFQEQNVEMQLLCKEVV